MSDAPVIILIEPQLGENVGAAARAMAHGGLFDLRLVNPRKNISMARARTLAMIGKDIIDNAKIYATLPQAMEDLHGCLATSARLRRLARPVLTPRQAGDYMHQEQKNGRRLGILFGCEASGLDNESLSMAEAMVCAPFPKERRSINLAQAVFLLSYEWAMASHALDDIPQDKEPPAQFKTLQTLFMRLEEGLAGRDFFQNEAKAKRAKHRLRASLLRAKLSEDEANLWHGVVRSLIS